MKSFWLRNSCFTYLYAQFITLFTSKFTALHKKWSFPFRISSVNVTKSAVSLRIWSHLLKKSIMENFIICAVLLTEDGGLLQRPPERNYFEKVHQNEITLKGDNQNIFIFNKMKTSQKEISKRLPILHFRNTSQKHVGAASIFNSSKLPQIRTTLTFRPWKLLRKMFFKLRTQFFVHRIYVKKSTLKWRRYFAHWNYVKQSTSKQGEIFAHRN